MVNHEKIRNKLRAIKTCLEKLEELKKSREDEFLCDYKPKWAPPTTQQLVFYLWRGEISY